MVSALDAYYPPEDEPVIMHLLVRGLLNAAVGLLQPDSLSYVVLNHGRPAGEMSIVTAGDSTVVRFQYTDRNRGPKVETHYRLTPAGAIASMEARGLGTDFYQTPMGERFALADGMATWTSNADSGRKRVNGTAFYRARTPTPFDNAQLARFALHQPGQTGALLPAGSVHAEVVADTTVTADGVREHIRLVALTGIYSSSVSVWLDDRDAFFASAAEWFVTVRRGAVPALGALRGIEVAWHARQSAALAARLTPATPSAIVIRNGDVFDSETGAIRSRTSVVVKGDRIVAVGPADSIATPAGATVIDATGKTVIPGMWDMHTHLDFTNAEDGVMQLAAGITTARDLASDIDDAVSRRTRSQAGTMLAPRAILAGFMDGPGDWAGPTSILIRTEAEARAAIARYDSLGYKQIKVYNLIHPDLIPAIAAEAHKRGMRLSGHVPRGLSVPAAVTLGFDEIQHAAFLFSTFYEDSLFVPKMRSYGQVADAVAPTFAVDGAEMTGLLAFLREHGTVIDGTFNAWLDTSRPLPDGTDIIFGPTLAWLPPAMRREYSTPQLTSPQEAARAMAGNTAYMRLAKRLFDAGVTLVAGTDYVGGVSYHGELEIYERAGIPAASVLQIATIVPARVMKEDKDYGSIAPGKIADLVIVNGHPANRITDLRKTETVIRAGRMYRALDLYGAIGVVPR